jgi:uncharacterized protein
VEPLNAFALIDSSVDPRFDSTLNRPSLAQSFVDANGEVFTVVNNHFKSKGCSTDATGANADLGDGQGCWNAARSNAAAALADWVIGHPTGIVDDDVLIVGDLNSYAKEQPIDTLAAAGFVDLGAALLGPDSYSFAFDGQWGSLDYAIASPSMAAQVTGMTKYHINADEPSVLDYNTNFKSAAQLVSLYAPDQYRTADHDPVLVGIAPTSIDPWVAALPTVLWPPNHKMRTVDVKAHVAGEPLAITILGVASSEADSGLGADDVPNDIALVDADTAQVRAERYAATGRTYTFTVLLSDGAQTVRRDTSVLVPKSRRP